MNAELESRAFLLQDVTATERLGLEERALLEDPFFDELLCVEEGLLDEHVRGELTETLSGRMVSRLENVESWRRRRVFAEALATAADEGLGTRSVARPIVAAATIERARPPWRRIMVIAATLLAALGLAGGLGWISGQGTLVEHLETQNVALMNDTIQLQEGLDAARLELEASRDLVVAQSQVVGQLTDETARLETLVAELGRPVVEAPTASRRTVAFLLGLTSLRSESDSSAFQIPTTAETVRLQLDLEDDTDYESFTAMVTDSRGDRVWSEVGLALTEFDWGAVVEVELDVSLLSAVRYEVELEGVDAQGRRRDVGFYSLELGR